MNIIPLGKLAAKNANRDAIHIAVAPVIAADRLIAGQHVGIDKDGKASTKPEPIGIVDPFLTRDVKAGERFYLCLYPNTITSLEHHWVHPAFKDIPEMVGVTADAQKAESEAWLRDYARRVNPYLWEGVEGYYKADPEEAYQTLLSDLRRGTLTYHGVDMHGRDELIDEADLQYHASIVIGRPINFDQFEYFSCTC